MKAFIFFALISLVSTVARAQESVVVWSENAPLQWDDFAGKVKDTSTFDAESFAEVRYRYTFNSLKDFHFDVSANFVKNTSWIRKEYQSEALLKHEQLHFDIAELFSLKMREMFESYTYSKNYDTEIRLLFNKKKQEYHAMQNRYDDETRHSINAEKQKEWENYVATELQQMKMKHQQLARNDTKGSADVR